MRGLAVVVALFITVLLTGCEGRQGATGPTGPQGAAGPQGPTGQVSNANTASFDPTARWAKETGARAAMTSPRSDLASPLS